MAAGFVFEIQWQRGRDGVGALKTWRVLDEGIRRECVGGKGMKMKGKALRRHASFDRYFY